jgi:four helix bundle protein
MDTDIKGKSRFDLEERTFRFSKSVFDFVDKIPKTVVNAEIIRQVVRSTGSVGANYIEANESLSWKDYAFRVKICRKEAKETLYWLKLLNIKSDPLLPQQQALVKEITELMKIFGSILEKMK